MLNPPSSQNLVITLYAQNENQVLEAGAQGFGFGMTERGYRHLAINMYSPTGKDELLQALRGGDVVFACSYAGVGSRFTTSDGVNLWTATRIPFINLWFDHPAYNYQQHIVDSPYVVQAYHIRDHIEARRAYLPQTSSPSILLPLLFDVDYQAWRSRFPTRRSEVFYVKSGKQPEAISEGWKQHSKQIQDVIWHSVEQAKKDRNIDLVKTTLEACREAGLSSDNLGLLMGLVFEADDYIRAWRSDRLARALLPFPAHIVGRGWDYLKSGKTKAEFFDPMPAGEYLASIKKYKIVANANPLWRDGIHERVYHGIGAGCLTITDRSIKSDAVFDGVRNYIGFEWEDNLADRIASTIRISELGIDEYDHYYVTAAHPIIQERVIAAAPDYRTEVVRAAEAVRQQVPLNGIGLPV